MLALLSLGGGLGGGHIESHVEDEVRPRTGWWAGFDPVDAAPEL